MKNCKVIFACLLFLIAGVVNAAAVSVRASINKTALTLDDELTLTLTIDGAAGNLMPQLPSLPAFNVYSRATSTQVINGHAVTTFQYIMVPRFQGQTTIGPIAVTYGGQTYLTEPMQVTVYRTTAQTPPPAAPTIQTAHSVSSQSPVAPAKAPASMPLLERSLYNQATQKSGQPYFMVAAVSDKNPYENQSFLLAIRFYYNRPISGSAPYTAPSITNLFLEEISRSDGTQTIGNLAYEYVEIRYGASGVTAGKAIIGPAKISYVPASSHNLSIFRMFSAAMEEPKTAQSNSITLNIRSVPTQDQPSTFYGAVGSGYTLNASVDRNEVEAGDAINLTVKVNGPGNLKSTRDLKLPKLANFKTYDVVSSGGISTAGGTLRSYKIFKTVLVPISSGEYTVPPLFWSYYDPASAQYLTLKTEPISIQVTPASKADSGFDFRAHADLNGGVQTLGQDIRYLKSIGAPQTELWLSQVANWHAISIAAFCLLLFSILIAWRSKKTPVSHLALSKARAQLKRANNEQDIADALSLYLQIKYNIHTASLPLRQVQEELKAHNCSTALIERFATLWQQLEAARFAPIASSTPENSPLKRQAEQLLWQLDKGVVR